MPKTLIYYSTHNSGCRVKLSHIYNHNSVILVEINFWWRNHSSHRSLYGHWFHVCSLHWMFVKLSFFPQTSCTISTCIHILCNLSLLISLDIWTHSILDYGTQDTSGIFRLFFFSDDDIEESRSNTRLDLPQHPSKYKKNPSG